MKCNKKVKKIEENNDITISKTSDDFCASFISYFIVFSIIYFGLIYLKIVMAFELSVLLISLLGGIVGCTKNEDNIDALGISGYLIFLMGLFILFLLVISGTAQKNNLCSYLETTYDFDKEYCFDNYNVVRDEYYNNEEYLKEQLKYKVKMESDEVIALRQEVRLKLNITS